MSTRPKQTAKSSTKNSNKNKNKNRKKNRGYTDEELLDKNSIRPKKIDSRIKNSRKNQKNVKKGRPRKDMDTRQIPTLSEMDELDLSSSDANENNKDQNRHALNQMTSKTELNSMRMGSSTMNHAGSHLQSEQIATDIQTIGELFDFIRTQRPNSTVNPALGKVLDASNTLQEFREKMDTKDTCQSHFGMMFDDAQRTLIIDQYDSNQNAIGRKQSTNDQYGYDGRNDQYRNDQYRNDQYSNEDQYENSKSATPVPPENENESKKKELGDTSLSPDVIVFKKQQEQLNEFNGDYTDIEKQVAKLMRRTKGFRPKYPFKNYSEETHLKKVQGTYKNRSVYGYSVLQMLDKGLEERKQLKRQYLLTKRKKDKNYKLQKQDSKNYSWDKVNGSKLFYSTVKASNGIISNYMWKIRIVIADPSYSEQLFGQYKNKMMSSELIDCIKAKLKELKTDWIEAGNRDTEHFPFEHKNMSNAYTLVWGETVFNSVTRLQRNEQMNKNKKGNKKKRNDVEKEIDKKNEVEKEIDNNNNNKSKESNESNEDNDSGNDIIGTPFFADLPSSKKGSGIGILLAAVSGNTKAALGGQYCKYLTIGDIASDTRDNIISEIKKNKKEAGLSHRAFRAELKDIRENLFTLSKDSA